MSGVELTDCPDCCVSPGDEHFSGCDVERCTECGQQALGASCEHFEAKPQTWTGRWPGEVELDEGLAKDLNELLIKGLKGELRWSVKQERWVKPGIQRARKPLL